MFEITREHDDALDYYMNERIAYPNAEYDFTFEGRFLIYHTVQGNKATYYAIDMKTNLSSEVCHRTDGLYDREAFKEMIPAILSSIKYTGDRRYIRGLAPDPMELIDSIFRSVLPEYGYTIRETQIELCKNIYYGLTQKRVSICEAEVGTGKSLAYLVAAVCARKAKEVYFMPWEPITITTSNIELQKSLIEKDIPQLSSILLDYGIIDKPLTSALRKGKEHYFCSQRYDVYMKNISAHPEKHGADLAILRDQIFSKGLACDLDKISIPPMLKSRICAKDSCKNCKYIHQCKYARFTTAALSREQSLDFQVTNHNLYLMSLRKSGILKNSTCVIVDEAHKLKAAAQEIFGESISETAVDSLLNLIKVQCEKPENRLLFLKTMRNASDLNTRVFGLLRRKCPWNKDEPGAEKKIALDTEITSSIQKLIAELLTLDSLKGPSKGRVKTSGKELADRFEQYLRPDKMVTWIKPDGAGRIELFCSPKNLGKKMTDFIWRDGQSHVLTSGTMSDGRDFRWFKSEYGIDLLAPEETFESTTRSPFDYKNHTRLYIAEDMPAPEVDDPNYVSSISDRVVELVEATNGHTAILFTSYKLLRTVYDQTKNRLEKYQLFQMSKSSKRAISDFKKSRNGVLYASGSMWEGVDCIGDTLSSVIIVRLPFPIRSATMEHKKQESDGVSDFISNYVVPEMLVKLRQGAGRLVRSESDTGVISILDARAAHGAPYEVDVKIALQQYPKAYSVKEIAEFMHSVKSEEYFNT